MNQKTPTSITLRSRDWVAVADLNLNTAPGSELWHNDRLRDLLEYCGIGFATQTVVEGVKIGSSDDIAEVNRLNVSYSVAARKENVRNDSHHSN